MIDLKEMIPSDDDLWETEGIKIRAALSHQAKECALALLSVSIFEENKKATRFLAELLQLIVNPLVFNTDGQKKNDRFLFLLGPDIGDLAIMGSDNISVVRGTTIALPFDQESQSFYVPLLDGHRLTFPVMLDALLALDPAAFPYDEDLFLLHQNLHNAAGRQKKALIASSLSDVQIADVLERDDRDRKKKLKKISSSTGPNLQLVDSADHDFRVAPLFEQPSWEPCLTQKAADALFAQVKPSVAAWCLEQQGGRRYVALFPWENGKKDSKRQNKHKRPRDPTEVQSEHLETLGIFRQSAEDICIAKWGSVIEPQTIRDFFAIQKEIISRQNKLVVIDGIDVHHKKPVSWGGDNYRLLRDKTKIQQRTCVAVDFHAYIHKDFDWTLKRVQACLQDFGVDYLSRPKLMRRSLLANQPIVDALKKIPHVKVKNGLVGISILWPREPYCIPSLLQFERQYQGVRGPEDLGYVKPQRADLVP